MNLLDYLITSYNRTLKYPGIICTLRMDSVARHLIAPLTNLYLRISRSHKTIHSNNNRKTRKTIVSLTTFPARVNYVYLTIKSLLRQQYPPDKIILWLSKEQFTDIYSLPESLRNQLKSGLEIRFVEGDIKSHKKYYYAFKEFPDDYVILVDDDIIYDSSLVSNLLEDMKDGHVVCRYAFKITRGANGELLQYNEWPFIIEKMEGNEVFFGTGGGSIFIPSQLPKETLDLDKIMTLCPKADDVWLNGMCRLGEIDIKKNYSGLLMPVLIRGNHTLYSQNVGLELNDIQIQKLNEEFGAFD